MKIKAAILEKLRSDLIIDEIDCPSLKWGQVLVRVHFSGVCGSQIGEIDGVKGVDPYLPHLLGHEAGGEVLETGPGVRRVKAGDRVVLHWRPAAGLQCDPPAYVWNGKKLNAGWVTTFNDHAVVSENRLTPIGADVDLGAAALYGCALTTGFGIISRDAAVRIGDSVVVFGSGGVGLCVVLGARLAGANPIVATDLQPGKLDLARELGATHTFRGDDPDLAEKIRGVVGPGGADVTCDTTGVVAVIEQAYEIAGPLGRTVLAGVIRHDEKIRIFSLPLHFGKVLTGSHGGGAEPDRDIPRYLALQRAGRFDPSRLFSHQFALEDVNQALAATRSGEAIRCLIAMTD